MRGEVRAGRRERVWGSGSASGVHVEGPAVKAGRARACAERTANMENMLVTLEVSKLSGWLNVYADCRVESKTCDAGRGVGRGWEDMGRRQRISGMHRERARL